MKTAPPPAHLPEWDLDEGGEGDGRLAQYAKDHALVRDADPLDPFGAGARGDGPYG